MPDLEQQLTELGAAIEWPETPELRPLRLHAHREGFVWSRRALAAAAVVVLVAAALLAYAPSRGAIANFLNLHTTVQRVPAVPTPSPHPGQALGLGTPTTLAQAQSEVTWRIVVPPSLGRPNQVYVALPPGGPSGGEVTLVYTTAPAIKPSGQTGVAVLVTEARGSVNEQFFGKTLGPDTTIEKVDVNGHPGWWISGSPHAFGFTDADGNPYFDTLRLATNTLVFDDGPTVVRVEGDMTREQALQIAGTM